MSITGTAMPAFPAQTVSYRRVSAEVLYRYLKATHSAAAVSYDGDRTVTAGPVRIHYHTRAVQIAFPDPTTVDGTVAVYVPGKFTLGTVAAVVEGLLGGPQVTL